MTIYDGTWRFICIGTGPGPKNVLAQRVEDGKKCVFAYATWKHRIAKAKRIGGAERLDTERVHSRDIHEHHGRCAVDLQVGIVQVAVRTTNNGRQIFDVSCSDGKTRAVWEAGLANAINAFAGSGAQITIRVRVSEKNGYTNETITAFAPPGQALPPEQQGGGSGGGGFRRGGGGGGMSPEDKTRIAKMGAQGSAATIVAALFAGAGPEAFNEAVELHDKLTRKLYTDARSHEKAGGGDTQQGTVLQPGAQQATEAAQPQAQVLQPQTATPQTVAAGVPGVVVGAQALQPGGATDAAAAADVTAQNAAEQGDNIQWN